MNTRVRKHNLGVRKNNEWREIMFGLIIYMYEIETLLDQVSVYVVS